MFLILFSRLFYPAMQTADHSRPTETRRQDIRNRPKDKREKSTLQIIVLARVQHVLHNKCDAKPQMKLCQDHLA